MYEIRYIQGGRKKVRLGEINLIQKLLTLINNELKVRGFGIVPERVLIVGDSQFFTDIIFTHERWKGYPQELAYRLVCDRSIIQGKIKTGLVEDLVEKHLGEVLNTTNHKFESDSRTPLI